MFVFSDIVNKIKKLRDLKNSQDVALTLGITKAALSNHLARRTIPFEKIVEWCRKEKISLDWLLLGEGVSQAGGALDPELNKLSVVATEKRLLEIKAPDLLSPEKKGDFIVLLTTRCQSDEKIRNASKEEQEQLIYEIASQFLQIIQ